ncbi:hypothetical protein PoB_001431300 [Plakobranchus ocellatus]|uniref:Uncharacterized protein n=1 Tax=Plakobranchus ocellatus TaxID=259542 RepID=A0AAV3YZK9_9GAST|nr:hypothetical protein PoB_001431300 [Plakobranchus ocellatus]
MGQDGGEGKLRLERISKGGQCKKRRRVKSVECRQQLRRLMNHTTAPSRSTSHQSCQTFLNSSLRQPSELNPKMCLHSLQHIFVP